VNSVPKGYTRLSDTVFGYVSDFGNWYTRLDIATGIHWDCDRILDFNPVFLYLDHPASSRYTLENQHSQSPNYLLGVEFVASVSAIASKFLFTSTKKHFFNPANFGIITALIFTSDAWVSPGQWGDEWYYALLFMGAGGLILQRVGRWDTTAAFLGVYASLEAIRNIWLGWTWDVCIHRLMSGSLLLFALFMVTDPRSIPNSRRGRVIWATCIAVVTFILKNYFFIPSAVFWALFALAPFTVIIDTFCQEKQFNWETDNCPCLSPTSPVHSLLKTE
jgi:Na+-transporting NADH:ubiquinone oxidoreductase subunit NqrB